MRIFFAIIIGIHGFFHLLGFLKAFHLSDFKGLTLPISKIAGVFWLVAFLFFAIAAVLYLGDNSYWWLAAFLAVLVSQILIFIFWKDAKFGTFVNVLILVMALISFGSSVFLNKFNKDTSRDLTMNSFIKVPER